ncbi:hypothetical protein OAO01_01525, partial [Oligoflexia bacterium]|nr:hypothetical protein [Oligoflexia bacterium]
MPVCAGFLHSATLFFQEKGSVGRNDSGASRQLIMTNSCRNCSTQFEITNEDLAFYDKISPTFDNHKFTIPPPSLCPDCRSQRRLSWRNERGLYRRQCDFTKKNIISIFDP